MPLKVSRRTSTGALTISGTVAGQRVRRRAQSDDLRLAREEAATIEARILRAEWHGERRADRTFGEALLSYLQAAPRNPKHIEGLKRLAAALGDVPLAAIDQQTAIALKIRMLRPDAAPGTYVRAILMPLRAILNHASAQGWCATPRFVMPRENPGRTRVLLPADAERLVDAAAPHLRPLILFLIGTGARMSEAIELDWRDVDLSGRRAIFWRTKSGRRRVASLPPRVLCALANLPHREGAVFRRPDGEPYTDRARMYGGHIKTGWAAAIRRAGLDPELTPHDCRHTWASWHYAIHRDVLALKAEGGWSGVGLVERYAHLLPAGQDEAIRHFFGTCAAPSGRIAINGG